MLTTKKNKIEIYFTLFKMGMIAKKRHLLSSGIYCKEDISKVFGRDDMIPIKYSKKSNTYENISEYPKVVE